MPRRLANMVAHIAIQIALAPVFFALGTSTGLVLRLVRDPLRRRMSKSAASYWQPLDL